MYVHSCMNKPVCRSQSRNLPQIVRTRCTAVLSESHRVYNALARVQMGDAQARQQAAPSRMWHAGTFNTCMNEPVCRSESRNLPQTVRTSCTAVLASADSAVVQEAHRCNRDFCSIMPDVVEIAPALGVDMMNDNRFCCVTQKCSR